MSSPSPTSAPDKWRQARLGEVAVCILGGTPSTDVPQYWGGDVPWMASGDVHLRRIEDVPGRVTDRGLRSSNATLTDPPAVAVGLAGQGKTRGTVALTLCRLSTNQSIALLKANGIDLRTDYLFHDLDRRYEELRARSSGGGRGGLSKGILESVPIELPTLDEQATIARILDTVDAAIHETEAIIAKLKAVKQGLLHDLLTRGIDANGELRPPQAEAPHLYKQSAVGDMPREWVPSSAAAEFAIDSGITLGVHRLPRSRPRKYLRVANVHRARLVLDDIAELEASDAEAQAKALAPDDLLIVEGHASTSEIGRCAVADERVSGMLFQNHLFRLRATRLVPAFALLWLNSGYARAYWRRHSATSSGLNTINRAKLCLLQVAVPPPAEQRMIASREAAIAARIEFESRLHAKLNAAKSGLMDDLLTGRVRVTELLNSAATMPA